MNTETHFHLLSLNPLRRTTHTEPLHSVSDSNNGGVQEEREELPENDVRWSHFSIDSSEKAFVERKGEQQEEREEAESDSGQDIRRPSSSGELQLAQALRQQRGLEGSLRRGRLDRRGRRHHISQGLNLLLHFCQFLFYFSLFLIS